jgi:cytochrome c-type biogenesis protein CcmH
MRRQCAAVAAGIVLGFAGVVGAGVSGALAADRPSASELEGQLVCVTCKTTLDESDSPIARRMKAYIRTRIAQGATGQQIKDELVAQFGEGVLASPPTHGFDLLAWALPIGGIAAGAAGLGALAWMWSRKRDPGELDPPGGAPLDPELDRRVDEELARFED